ncbi:hypothetical protein [Acinetobacter sp.]|uniref:hypothetical protein n=1 Tax=Acinetobacter sp. TaxID=472 RepID=UPI0028A7C4A5|nr:hypothetical protein [Acinetobacter sp.]
MADQVITVQKLIDADKDATSLDTFINGTDSATVTTRKLRTYPSLAKAVKQVIETGGFEPFATETALLASVPNVSKKAAKALDTKKIWYWDGSSWTDTGLSELDQSIAYANTQLADVYTNMSDINATHNQSNNFERYLNFDDNLEALNIDSNGVIIADIEQTVKLLANRQKYVYSRYLNNSDQEGFVEADKNNVRLLKQSHLADSNTVPKKYTFIDGRLNAIYQSGDKFYKIEIYGHAINGLPNIAGTYIADKVDDIDDAVWETLSVSSSDWLPPMAVGLQSGGDGGSTMYTGGSHGSDGGGGGNPTARNVSFQIIVDGVALDMTKDSQASYSSMQVVIINQIFAYNSITLDIYAIQQTFKVNLICPVISVDCHVEALQDVNISTDNGLQKIINGFRATDNGTLLFVGSNKSRGSIVNEDTSGTKANFPNAQAMVLHSDNGQLVSWIDRGYEAGDGRYVNSNAPYLRVSSNGLKTYHAIVTQSTPLLSGQSYKWRGAYYLGMQNPIFDHDGFFAIARNTQMGHVIVRDAQTFYTI